MLHAGHRVPAGRLGVQRRGDVGVRPVLAEPGKNVAQLRVREAAGVAVVALLERQRSAVQQALAAHALGQRFGHLAHRAPQRPGQVVERLQRQRLPVDRVAAEQLVGALAGQHHLDVLAGLAGDEEQAAPAPGRRPVRRDTRRSRAARRRTRPGLTTLAMWRAPMASAEATATSTSEKPSRSKPVVKVISRGLCRIASAAMAVESIPPDRNAPTVTSARMCLATESSSTAVISS